MDDRAKGRPLLTRREMMALAGAAVAAPLLPRGAMAGIPPGVPLHGLSAFGELKYPLGFDHFDYGSQEAPTGGTFVFQPSNWAYNQNRRLSTR